MIAGRKLGTMQGRLLPKFMGRYQAHPIGYWQQEFLFAAGMGLDLIEFILDFNEAQNNPLLSERGVEEILHVSEASGVRIETVCADYFMEAPLHTDAPDKAEQSLAVLVSLITNGNALGITDIVIPCVDQSSLRTAKQKDAFIRMMGKALNAATKAGINLALETDLPPMEFRVLLDKLDSPHATVNYDTGNSASLGFDPKEEFAAYGSRISDIHIKDRTLGGGSVVLGTGHWQHETFFRLVDDYNYSGPIIMQAYRDEEGTTIFREQLYWLQTHWRSSNES